MAENVIAAGSKTRPLMLEKGMYDSWKTRIILYIRGKKNGEMLNDSIDNDPYQFKSGITVKDTNGVTDICHPQRLEDLVDKTSYVTTQTAKETWDRVKELMEGIEMTKQERESMLYDEFDKFTSEPGESIYSYNLRFKKLINDMKMIPMTMSPMQINTKFMNHLQPEWSRFVTAAKQARDIHSFINHINITNQALQSPPLQSYALTVVQQPPTYQPDTGLAIPTFLPSDDLIESLNKAMIFLSLVYRLKFPSTNSQLQTSSNPRTQATNQNDQVMVHNVQGRQSQGYMGNAGNNQTSGARQCTARKRVKDSEWFKDKMLLAQAQEAGVLLNEEQHDFLADSLEKINDCKDLELQATTNFKANHIDAYDSDCDDEATTKEIFMVNLLLVGSLNDDTVETHYDSDIHFESYDELTDNNNVISYTDYTLTIGNDEDNYVLLPVHKNDMMLSVIEQMKSQVEKYNMVNQESKSMNELLTSELERYKDKVRVLEYAVKDGEQEAYLSRELYMAISDQNRKKNFETLIQDSSESKFDECIKKRTTLSPHQIGSWEKSDIKGAFKKDVIPFSENLKETFKLFENGFIPEVKEMKDIFEQMEYEVDQHVASIFKKLLEQSRALKPLDEHIGGNEKWAPVTCHRKNNKPYVDASRTKQTIETITQKHAVEQNTRKTDNTMLPSTGRVSSTNASGSKPRSNTKNDRIQRTSSRSKQNKVEAPHRKFKSSANKNNHVSYCNANVKNVAFCPKKEFWVVMDMGLLKNGQRLLGVVGIESIDIVCNEKQAQVSLNATVRYLRTDNDIEFNNQTLRNYTEDVGITHHTSTVRTPQQNGVVEMHIRTLAEAARTMLIFSKSLLFLWAEAIAIACYTQNCSLIYTRYNKTPYELLRDCKLELKYLHVFGALCYPTNDFEDLGKLQPKAYIGIFIGYSPSKKAYKIYNKRTRHIMETMNVQFDELTLMASEQHG
ncbi:retrovirus-related pol polyprotein from transposon TNT 1-94 [Tanacetum coccineum]